MTINSKREAQEKLTILGMEDFDADTISYEDVKKAYKRESLCWHPDKYPAGSKDEAEEKFKEINNAHNDLEEFIRIRRDGYFCPYCHSLIIHHGPSKIKFCGHCIYVVIILE